MWILQTPSLEPETHGFEGQPQLSPAIKELGYQEIYPIIMQIRDLVKGFDLVNYKQVFSHSDRKEKIICIDPFSADQIQEMRQQEGMTEKQLYSIIYFKILFDYEYDSSSFDL